MKRLFPYSSYSNSRVFTSCLLSFLMLMSPIASVAASLGMANSVVSAKADAASKLTPEQRLEASLFKPALAAPLVNPVTATKSDSFPVHPSGQAEPGDVITYTVDVANISVSDATGVTFADTIDPNTTRFGADFDLKVSPVAINDTYVTAQASPLNVGAPGVLGNDTGLPAPTAVPIAAGPTTGGGTVTLNADGSFTYNPAPAFTGADTFTYTAINGQTPPFATDNQATVTINVDAAPSVTSTTPTNGAVNQVTNTNITITFSEAVNVTGNWFTISCTSSGLRNVADTGVAGGPTTFTINPNTDFTQAETCTVTVDDAAISDQDTNDPPDNMAADYVFSFTMDAAPSVSSTTPTNGATGIPTTANISVTFSESVSLGATPVTISCATSGSHTSVASGGPTTWTFNPAVDFAQNELCTVTVVAAQVSDSDANDPPNNMLADYVFSFTTDAAPSVTATTPTNGATNQPTNTDITLTFSESVSLGATPVTISCTVSGAHTSVVSGSPNTIFTVNPNVDFGPGETCTVTVLAAQVSDSDTGDPPDNMLADYVFSFTTDVAPTVTATTPTNGAIQVANNANVSITFSEGVNVTGNWFSIVCGTSGTHDTTNSLVTGGPTTFTINPNSDFANGESCTATVLAAQVTDQDTGDPPDNMAANYVFAFTIDQAPSVITTIPTNNATNIAQSSTVTINFSENVNVAAAGVTINCGVAVAFTPALPQNNVSSLVLTPTSPLPPGSDCTVTVDKTKISDTDTGDPPDNMVNDFVFTFKVKPDAVDDTYPVTLLGNVSTNSFAIPYSVTSNDLSAAIFTISAVQGFSTIVTNTITTTSTNGGNIVMTVSGADRGKFTYDPPAGFEGTDTFTYTISRTDGGGTDTATVSMPVNGMVWFIDNNGTACTSVGCGRLSNPFTTLAAFNGLNDNAATPGHGGNGDNIFIYTGVGNYTAPLTLLNSQRVIGQGATSSLSTLAGVTSPTGSPALPSTGGTKPTITSAGNGFALAQDNQFYGLAFSNTAGTAVTRNGAIGTLIFGDVTITNTSLTSGSGIVLLNGGAGTVTSTGINTIQTDVATALLLTSTNIGSGNITFRSISAGNNGGGVDPANGILLSSTGTAAGNGSLIVTGNSAGNCGGVVNVSSPVTSDCTGGTIQKTTGDAISLASTKAPSFTRMYFFDNAGSGIKATTVSSPTIISCDFDSNGDQAAPDEANVYLSETYGTATITNSWLTNSYETDLRIENSHVTNGAMTANISGTTVINNGGSTQVGNIFNFLGTLTSNMTLNLSNSRFSGNQVAGTLTGDGVHANLSGGTMDVEVSNTTFQNNFVSIGLAHGGSANSKNFTYDIHDNPTITGSAGSAINVTAIAGFAGDTFVGKIRNNVIGTIGVANSGSVNGFGMDIDNESIATYTTSITGNTIREIRAFDGIFARQVVSAGNTRATITGNNITINNVNASNVFDINAAITSAGTMCSNISGNTLAAVPFIAFRMRVRRTAGTHNITQATPTAAANAAELDDANSIPNTQVDVQGTNTFSQPACATPPILFKSGGVDAERSTTIVDNNIVSQAKLNAIVEAAIGRWTAAGLTSEQIAAMRRVKFEVADLPGAYLAEASGNLIRIDINAGGNGWFIDATPQDDAEFAHVVSGTHRYTTSTGAPAGRIDLLTAIIHELGHDLKLDDTYAQSDRNNLMYGYLTVGERRLPAMGQARFAEVAENSGPHFLTLEPAASDKAKSVEHRPTGSETLMAVATATSLMPSGETLNYSIGNLPAGKHVRLTFKVTVDTPFPGTQASNQGTVAGTLLPATPFSVVTDDPGTGAIDDATITPVLGPPVAGDDAYTAFKNTPLNIAAPGVLANDTNNPTVSAIGGCADVTAPFSGCATTAGGTVTMNADGSFTYTPLTGYTGADSFTYTATNVVGSDTATVNITVADTSAIYINEVLFDPTGGDAPNEYIEIRGPANATIPAGTYFVAIEGDATDNPGDVQTIINLSGLTFGSNGFLVLLQQSNTYTTAAGATVITSTTVGFGGLPGSIFQADAAATDLENGSSTFMLIQTGVAPTLTDDIDANDDATADGTAFAGWNVRDSIGALDGSSGTDIGYGALTFVFGGSGQVAAPNTMAVVGFAAIYVGRIGDSTGSTGADWAATGALGGAAPNWTLGASPEPPGFANKPLNHIGASNFVNLAPVNTVPGAQAVNEDTALVFTGATQISIADADAGTAAVKVTLTAVNGTMSLSGTAGLTFTPPGGSNDGTNDTQMIFTGTIANINTALNNLTFTPTLNFFSPPDASITILTDDQGNSGVGGAQTDSDTVNITINSINDPPSFTIAGNPPAVNEDAGAQTVTSFATSISSGAGDPAQTLTFNVSPTGTTGNIAFSSGPSINSTTGALTYTTSSDTNGTATFSVTLSDNGSNVPPNSNTSGAQNFTITVNAVNDAPSFQILSNPPAVNEDAGAQTVNSFATNFQPGPVTATDEIGQTLVGYTVTQTGTTGNLTFTSGPSINNAGQLTYTPTSNTSGTATYNAVATDSGSGTAPNVNQSAPVAFTITVNGANDAPVLDNTGNMSLNAINEDVPSGSNNGTLVSDLIASAGGDRITDVDAGALEGIAVIAVDNTNGSWQFSTDNGTNWIVFGSPDALSARLLAANANTRVRFGPTLNFNGTVNPGITFRAWDQTSGTNGGTADVTVNGGTTAFSTATETAAITVNPVNDTPTANAQTVGTAEDTPVGITLTGTDVETASGSMTFTVTVLPANGTLTGTGANRTYTPNPNYNGPDSFKFTVTDTGDGASPALTSAEATISINVAAQNDAPVNSIPGAQSVNENGTLTFNAANSNLVSIADVDAGTAAVRVQLTATNGTITLSGTTGLAFTVGDGTSDTTMTFTGTITNINNALNGMSYAPNANYDGPASIQIVTNDQGNSGAGGAGSDTDTINITVIDGGTLAFSSATYTVAEGAGSATITVNRTGGSSGTATVQYTTSNGSAISGSDYTTASGTLTFGNGVTSQTFSVPITNDTLDEADETVNLTLSNPAGTGGLGVQTTAVLTITDNDPPPNMTINDVSVPEGNSGTSNAVFTVTLSAPSGLPVTVNYQTANGSASSPSDYQGVPSTLLTFNPGETTKPISIVINGDTGAEIDETFFVNLSGATNATITDAQGLGVIISDDTPVIQFTSANQNVNEGAGHIAVTVTRLGDLTQPARIDYATSDPSGLNNCFQVTGNASQRCDYATVVGILRFAAGEASKDIIIPIVDDVYLEGNEIFTLTLSNSVGGDVGSPNTMTITINDNDVAPAPNPIDNDAFFIRQLYIDVLGRLPEPGAVNAWLAILNNCPVPSDPVNGCDRIAVAYGFLRSPEFQDRGYFVYRHYSAVLGRIPLYSEFIPDMAKVNGFLSSTDLEANKIAYTAELMNRPEFHTIYDPTINNPTAYVDKLLQIANLPNHPGRAGWIAGLTNSTLTRAQVLRQFIDSSEVYTKYVNEAFIIMNYFGLLRRSADAAYQTWFDIFNNSNNYRLIINGFINSPEYRLRFGP